jgi:uncharacterized membrane protein required for colicin V production
MNGQWIDLGILVIGVISIVTGYLSGFLVTIFSVVGYVVGGVGGLELAIQFQNNLSNPIGKFSMFITAIVVGSTVGQWLMKKAGKQIHQKVLFGPFQWIDSVLGAFFALLRAVVLLYLVFAIVMATPWKWGHQNLPQSKIYQEMQKRAPHVLTQVTDQIKKFT